MTSVPNSTRPSAGTSVVQEITSAYSLLSTWTSSMAAASHGSVENEPGPPFTTAVNHISIFPNEVNGTNRSQNQSKNGLTFGMKHIRQHVAQRKVVWTNKIVVNRMHP